MSWEKAIALESHLREKLDGGEVGMAMCFDGERPVCMLGHALDFLTNTHNQDQYEAEVMTGVEYRSIPHEVARQMGVSNENWDACAEPFKQALYQNDHGLKEEALQLVVGAVKEFIS